MHREDRRAMVGGPEVEQRVVRNPDRDAAVAASGSHAGPLLKALRDWRVATARDHGVPAYVVFHDATLEAIAVIRPQTLDDLRGISGIGAKKLERYGSALLSITTASA